jgi:hypothetical protein
MKYQDKRKRQMKIIRIVALICAILIIGSVVTTAIFVN